MEEKKEKLANRAGRDLREGHAKRKTKHETKEVVALKIGFQT
jgi:hypothetical protein